MQDVLTVCKLYVNITDDQGLFYENWECEPGCRLFVWIYLSFLF